MLGLVPWPWETRLYYFRARWYTPETGRWLSKDPIGIEGGLNQYVFVDNNPVNFMDPMGWLPFRNASSHSIVVGGGIGRRDGHDGPHIQVVVPPGGRVDAYNPAFDANGRGPLHDVDTIDKNGDGIAPPARGGLRGVVDMIIGEKVSGDDTGRGYTLYDLPGTDRFGILIPNNVVKDIKEGCDQ